MLFYRKPITVNADHVNEWAINRAAKARVPLLQENEETMKKIDELKKKNGRLVTGDYLLRMIRDEIEQPEPVTTKK